MDKLLWACKNGELEELTKNKDLVKANGTKLLISSCDYGHAEIVKYLISQGVDVNVANQHGITPILSAIYEDHAECVRILVKNGANKNGKTLDGQSYLDVASSDIKKILNN